MPHKYTRVMDDVFGSLDGIEIVMDDILVHGCSLKEHNRRLIEARKVNLKLILKKTQLEITEVKFVGTPIDVWSETITRVYQIDYGDQRTTMN